MVSLFYILYIMQLIQLLSFLIVFAPTSWTLQAGELQEFLGTIQLQDKSVITYKISFEEHADGTITGKSITDFAGSHRTESRIKGRLNRKKNLISFSELENVYTKSDSEEQDFCYIHLYNAKIKIAKKKSIIQGHFYSRYLDGSLCIEGDIYLVGAEQFIKQIEKVEKTKDRAKHIIKNDEKLQKMEEVQVELNNTKIAIKEAVLIAEDKMTLKTIGNSVTIKIWDAEQLDGDMISIRNDDNYLLHRYRIAKHPKEIVIPMDNDTLQLILIADNEGRIPPNSANVEIVTSEGDIPLKLKLNKGKEAEVLIVRKK